MLRHSGRALVLALLATVTTGRGMGLEPGLAVAVGLRRETPLSETLHHH